MNTFRRALLLVLAGGLGGLAGTADAEDAGATFLYLHDKGTGSIHGFSVAGTALTPLAGFPVEEPGSASITDAETQTIAYAPGRHLLFTSCHEGVNVYEVEADGSLSSVAGSPFGPGNGSYQGVGVIENKRGIGVYALGRNLDAITAFTADGEGALTEIEGSPFETLSGSAYGLCAFGNVVFVPGYSSDAFESYKVGKDFGLTRTKTTAPGLANYFAFPDPKGKFVFSSTYGQAVDTVYALKVSKASGKMKPVKGSPFPMGEAADLGSDLLVGPTGLAVGLSYNDDTAQVMTWDRKGKCLPLGAAQDLDLDGQKVGVFLPSGSDIAVACDITGDLRTFTVDPATGALSLADTEDLGDGSHAFNGIIVVKR